MFTLASNDVDQTSYGIIMRKKPDSKNIRRFGCKAYIYPPKVWRNSKFEAKAQIGVLVGFLRGNSYKNVFPENRQFIISRDVNVDEQSNGTETVMGATQSHSGRRKPPTALPFVTTPQNDLYPETEENLNEQGQENSGGDRTT